MHRLVLLLLGLSACFSSSGRGPDLGACAEYPDGVYTYGEAGIGTCLAGPTDVAFATLGGRSVLVVSNADPFRSFTGGSVMFLDAAAVRPGRGDVRIDDLDPVVLDAEPFIGALAVDPARDRVLVAGRLSPESVRNEEPDRVWFVDARSPSEPGYAPRPFVTVRQDPLDVVVDDDRAIVLNATDASLSVIDLERQELLDPSPTSLVVDPTFTDGAGAGCDPVVDPACSRAEVAATVLSATGEVFSTDTWTLRRTPTTVQAWVTTLSRDGERVGLRGWIDGGDGFRLAGSGGGLDGSGLDIDPGIGGLTALGDPWVFNTSGALQALYAANGAIGLAAASGAGDWTLFNRSVLEGDADWSASVGGPSLLPLPERSWLYFDGRSAADARDGAIGLATTADGTLWSPRSAPVLVAEAPWIELIQPDVLRDPHTDRLHMYVSAWDGDRWVIARSVSDAPDAGWSAPEEVLAVPGADAAAPWVAWVDGRYRMWLTVGSAGDWAHATAWSWDGREWSEPEIVLDGILDDPTGRPPRAGIQATPDGGWRIRGASRGPLAVTVVEGEPLTLSGDGLQLRAASGHAIGAEVGGRLSAGGVELGSLARTQGYETLYVTLVDGDGVRRLGALRRLGARWTLSAGDCVPTGTGGNVGGAQSPVVYAVGDGWHLLYAAADAAGVWTMHHATSADGLTFTPSAGTVLGEGAAWSAQARIPRTVEAVEGGYRLWYGGSDGERFRIGTATSVDGVTWTAEPGEVDDWAFGPGEPGAFDDSGATDPMVVTCDGQRTLFYSAWDGSRWSIGQAVDEGGVWVRRTAPLEEATVPALSAMSGSFAALGVRRPLVVAGADGACAGWFNGVDGAADRIGDLLVRDGHLFPLLHTPGPDDAVGFTTRKGEPGTSSIDLGQVVGSVTLPGGGNAYVTQGPGSMWLDRDEGMLYVVSRIFGGVIVVDVRDDSTATWTDLNYLDIETVLRFQTVTGTLGFYEALGVGDTLYISAREPDAVYAVDISGVVDDDVREARDIAALHALPVHDLNDDAGEPTQAAVGAAGLAWVPGQNLLLMTHIRDNSLSVFDLDLGVAGQEIAWLPSICEMPDTIAVAPDGRSAVIACYVGSVWRGEVSSQLLVLDLEPSSPTFLQITTTVSNE